MDPKTILVAFLLGYTIGSIPIGYLLAKKFLKIDIRQKGSGNIGATNVFRVSKSIGLLTLVLDVVKGLIPVIIMRYYLSDRSLIEIAGLATIVGNFFPIFLGFRGGKGIATTLGVLIGLEPSIAIGALFVWLCYLVGTGYVSVASIAAALFVASASTMLAIFGILGPIGGCGITLIAIYAIIKHRPNMLRLRQGTEPKIGQPSPPDSRTRRCVFVSQDTSESPAITKQRAARKFPILKFLHEDTVHRLLLTLTPILKYGEIHGIKSYYSNRVVEFFMYAFPEYAYEMFRNVENIYGKIEIVAQKAAAYGATVLGLGAHTGIIGDGGIVIAERLKGIIHVTNGNKLTAVSGIKSAIKAADLLKYDLATSTITVIGARGSVGSSVVKLLLAWTPCQIRIVGRPTDDLNDMAMELNDPRVQACNLKTALQQSNMVICAVSAEKMEEHELDVHWFQKGAVVVEMSRPRVLAEQISNERKDVLVIAGGMYELPGEIVSTLKMGYKGNEVLACMAETILITLNERYDLCGVGRDFDLEKLQAIAELADNCNFKLGRFRACDDKPLEPRQFKDFLNAANFSSVEIDRIMKAFKGEDS